jgi:hypothetical protein
MIYQKPGFFLCLGGAVVLLLSSCAAHITGKLDPDSSGDFFITAALQPRVSALIRSLSAVMGEESPPEFILDGGALAQSMSAAPGIASVSFRNTGPAAIEGPVKISRIGEFLAPAGASGSGAGEGFITFDQALPGSSSGDGGSRCTIRVDRESGPEILSLISPDVSDYLSALMAPIATGELLTKEEYLGLVASLYGKAVADEISRASIRASIEFPGPVTAVRGGTWSGRRAEFDIPLADILVLSPPLVYEVLWK